MESAWLHIPESENVCFGLSRNPPPGYRIVTCDDHTMWLAPDGKTEGAIHWDKWASYRGAWKHYRESKH